MKDEEQDSGDDEDDSITPQDMMSFSWQIAQGMVNEKKFVLFNCVASVVICSKCLNTGKSQLITESSIRVSGGLTVRVRFVFSVGIMYIQINLPCFAPLYVSDRCTSVLIDNCAIIVDSCQSYNT